MKVRDDLTKIHCGWCGEPQHVRGAKFSEETGDWYFHAWCKGCTRITTVTMRWGEKSEWESAQRRSEEAIYDTRVCVRGEF